MNDWFSWNGVRCTDYGIRVSEQPPITIPAERVAFTNVPGRPGSLTTLEGDDVYDDLVLTRHLFRAERDPHPGDRCVAEGRRHSHLANRQGGFYYARSSTRLASRRFCAETRIALLRSTSDVGRFGMQRLCRQSR